MLSQVVGRALLLSRALKVKHITAVKPKFTLTEVDIKSLERLLAL